MQFHLQGAWLNSALNLLLTHRYVALDKKRITKSDMLMREPKREYPELELIAFRETDLAKLNAHRAVTLFWGQTCHC